MLLRFLKTIAAVTLIGMALSACETTEGYEQMLNTWLGKPVDRLVEAWGPPQASYTYGDGRRSLQYSEKSTRYYPPMTSYDPYSGRQTTVFDGYARDMSCVTTFEADAQGIIRSWKWHGNSCVAKPSRDFSGSSPK